MVAVFIALAISYLLIGIGILLSVVVGHGGIVWIEQPRVSHFACIVLLWPALISEFL
jgi:hypothetical protein